jgi:RNA polymerase sigma-70 factor, ECF subfamily
LTATIAACNRRAGVRTVGDQTEEERVVGELARAYEHALYGVALRLCSNPADARDLVQDTFERALRHGDRRPGADARAWLFTILNNLFIDRCRRRAREPRTEDVQAMELPAPPPPEAEPAWAQLTLSELHAVLPRLDADLRELYQCCAIEGRSYAEVAERLRIPKATVGTRLLRARRRLRELLSAPAKKETP